MTPNKNQGQTGHQWLKKIRCHTHRWLSLRIQAKITTRLAACFDGIQGDHLVLHVSVAAPVDSRCDLRRADTQTPTRHSVFSTHSDTQAVPAFHCSEKSSCPKIFRPQFWGRKWLRQFYGRLAIFGSFCWKTPMPIKFLVLWGGHGFFGRGGGSADFIFMGVGIFPNCIRMFKGNFSTR